MVFLVLAFTNSVRLFQVDASSMNPRLIHGDIILCIENRQVRAGDIVVAAPTKLNFNYIIKRVNRVEERSIQSSPKDGNRGDNEKSLKTVYAYFLLGDNLEHSIDSREFGFLDESEIICVASLLLANSDSKSLSFNRFSTL